jgi:hypothetical protein
MMLSLEGMNSITSCTEAKVASKNSSNNYNSDLLYTTVPIKVVDKTTLTTLQNKITKGEGIMSTIAGIPLYANHRKYAKNVWRVLLDSGSEGDILFIHKSQTHKRDCIKTKRRYAAQRWRTSIGTFSTEKVGKLEMLFPEFSSTKEVTLVPDVLSVPSDEPLPQYDLILGIRTLINLGCVLDFNKKTVTIDEVTLPMKAKDSLLMKSKNSLKDQKALNNAYNEYLEPTSTQEATHRAVRILDSKYEKADLPAIVRERCSHLTLYQRCQLQKLLTTYEVLFDGTLGDWKTNPVSIKLKPGATPYHGRAYPVPHVHLETLRKEVNRLERIGVLIRQPDSEWASPTFIIPKKDGRVRVTSDLREVNKRIIRSPFPIPKIATMLQEMEGFTYATALDLNMGYYTIRLDGDAQKICTIIFPWGKYSYQRLPMGISNAPDIFQEKMSGLMQSLEYVKTYIDDILVITKDDFVDHLKKLEQVLIRLRDAGLRVNIDKSFFAEDEIEYLGYILTQQGIKPQAKKVSAIIALLPPKNVRELRRFLGMVQYYRDLWLRRSHLLAPLTDLVGECGTTKTTRASGSKKKRWHWDDMHQKAFEATKKAMSKDILLAYPNYNMPFEVYTDASKRQLGAVIVQNNRPIALFSRKLSKAQRKYSITELELLSIIECLKEFRGMLWGQPIKVYTDHKNLTRDALGLTSDRVYRWRLLLEEYGPEIIYIKGVDNTVADAISRLEYDPSKNMEEIHMNTRYCAMATLLSHSRSSRSCEERGLYVSTTNTHSSQEISDMSLDIFTNDVDDEEEIYPPTIAEIANLQKSDQSLKEYFNLNRKDKKVEDDLSLKVIDDTELVVYKDTRLVIPPQLQDKIVAWYHHYLQHPGQTRLEETIAATMYWKTLRSMVRGHVKRCHKCQLGKRKKRKHGKLPTKIAETTPWRCVCVDLIGPYTIKAKDGTILDFMCLTMIDPATGWFEIIELPLASITVKRKGEEISEVIIDKSSAQIAKLFNKQWLSRYPRAKTIVYDNGSEFKLYFEELCDSYNLKRKPTSVKNPQANAILERIHGVLGDMMRTSGLDMADTVTPDDVDQFLTDAAWAIRSTYHTVLKSSPGAAIFGRDMLFDIPYLADWNAIGRRRQNLVDHNAALENAKRVDYDYVVGQKVILRKDGILRKAELKYEGPYTIKQVHVNGTVRIQKGTISERLSIRRIEPYNQ